DAGGSGRVPRPRAEIEQSPAGLRSRRRGRPRDSNRTRAASASQRPDRVDERAGIWKRLPVRPRLRRGENGHGLLAGKAQGAKVLSGGLSEITELIAHESDLSLGFIFGT